jgi:hypothetical protein
MLSSRARHRKAPILHPRHERWCCKISVAVSACDHYPFFTSPTALRCHRKLFRNCDREPELGVDGAMSYRRQGTLTRRNLEAKRKLGKWVKVTASQLVIHFPSTLTLSHSKIDGQHIHCSPQSTAIISLCLLHSFLLLFLRPRRMRSLLGDHLYRTSQISSSWHPAVLVPNVDLRAEPNNNACLSVARMEAGREIQLQRRKRSSLPIPCCPRLMAAQEECRYTNNTRNNRY